MSVPASPETVTMSVRSAGVAASDCKHATAVPATHDAVVQDPSAICTLGVKSTTSKLMPATVALNKVVKGRFTLNT